MTDERLSKIEEELILNQCSKYSHAKELIDEIKRLRAELAICESDRATNIAIIIRDGKERDEMKRRLSALTEYLPSREYLLGVSRNCQHENDTQARSNRYHAEQQVFINWLRRCAALDEVKQCSEK
jgi:hypothetical protein